MRTDKIVLDDDEDDDDDGHPKSTKLQIVYPSIGILDES